MFKYYELINHCLGKQLEDETFKIKNSLKKMLALSCEIKQQDFHFMKKLYVNFC